ncbi:MAG: phosphoglucosamine mutase [Clostridiales bacterium]|jgi:phosphoglucosamine mutase|nr:phosphoglucosamine mutase [Clostridiales bacterium]
MGKYFGTDGFRGEANVGLTVDHAVRIGRFLGYAFNKDHKARIVIGKDTRLSSYMLEDALAAGITASGGDAYLLHVTTTPSVSFITRSEQFDCGVMISASHNPFYDNGIKIMNGNGEKMDDVFLEELERFLDGESGDIPYSTREHIGKTIDYYGGRNQYIGYLMSMARNSYQGYKVGLDCANGSTWMIAKSVFDALGAKTFVINNQPNGLNINLDCGSTHIQHLQKLVVEKELDVGFAFDGDADRCLAVDEKGKLVDGDLILYIYARFMKERGNLTDNTVVTTIMSNLGLYKALEELDIAYKQTAVGDRYVFECMKENGHMLGGEQSGHIIFGKYANTGDGVLTAIKLMQAMITQKSPLSKLAEPMTIYPQVLKNVLVRDKDSALEDPQVLEAAKKAEEGLHGSGRVLLRKSGTEPLLRVMAEAPTQEACHLAVESIVAVIASRGHLAEAAHD